MFFLCLVYHKSFKSASPLCEKRVLGAIAARKRKGIQEDGGNRTKLHKMVKMGENGIRMENFRRLGPCFLNFCAKCADVEKTSCFLCRIDKLGVGQIGCKRNGVIGLRVI